MVEIFDYPVNPEMGMLEELAEDLEGVFHVIAHAGHEENLEYIKECQKYFREKYSKYLCDVSSDVGVFHIIPAYETLQELLHGNPSPDKIKQTCEECIDEHLMGGFSEEYAGVFAEFYSFE